MLSNSGAEIIAFLLICFIYYNDITFMELISENIFILLLIGGIEYYFFINVASKYVPVLPSFLPNVVQKSIQNL